MFWALNRVRKQQSLIHKWWWRCSKNELVNFMIISKSCNIICELRQRDEKGKVLFGPSAFMEIYIPLPTTWNFPFFSFSSKVLQNKSVSFTWKAAIFCFRNFTNSKVLSTQFHGFSCFIKWNFFNEFRWILSSPIWIFFWFTWN